MRKSDEIAVNFDALAQKRLHSKSRLDVLVARIFARMSTFLPTKI